MGSALRRWVLAHRGWRYRTRVDPAEIAWLRETLAPGDVAVDVGAHKGAYTYWMRRSVGPTGLVVAFEPQPELAAYLRRCTTAFAWRNVLVEELALSGRAGSGTLHLPYDEPSPAASLDGASLPGGGWSYEVTLATLDAWWTEHGGGRAVRLVKCDVEGHELDVLEGARDTLGRDRPSVLFECEQRHAPDRTVTDVFEWLAARGYDGTFFWDGERHPVAAFDPAVHQVEGRKPYMNNFVFEPVG